MRSNAVLWIGQLPPAHLDKEFGGRDLRLEYRKTVKEALADLLSARAVVISCSGESDPLVAEARLLIVDEAMRHGVAIEVVAPFQEAGRVSKGIATKWFTNRGIVDVAQTDALPQRIARVVPEAAAFRDLKIAGAENKNPEQLALLQRAFSDCQQITLQELVGGRSAQVYQVYARLSDSRAGPYPLPFFAKIDRRAKIERELRNYRECTTHFVPFYARPNLDPERCLLGAEYGLIVGNYVEHSESLLRLVNAGRAYNALHSLFEDALRGWRAQSQWDDKGLVNAPITQSMGNGALFGRKPSQHLVEHAEAAKTLGLTRDPEAIAAALDGLPKRPHLVTMTHGDLHGDNVQVRAGQAILIDFASVQRGPLVADPAQLEVALCMHADADQEDGWLKTVERLYDPAFIEQVPPPCDPVDPMANLWNCVRQIRRLGLGDQRSAGEYATVLAAMLLRQASHGVDGDETRRVRRAAFLMLADRLTSLLAGQPGAS